MWEPLGILPLPLAPFRRIQQLKLAAAEETAAAMPLEKSLVGTENDGQPIVALL